MTEMRKGFTMVEVLITIVVIGIMASALMIGTVESFSTAETNNIISNMRQIKIAVFAWYKDNLSRIVHDSDSGYKIRTKGTDQDFAEFVRDHKAEILYYLDNMNAVTLRSSAENSNDTREYLLTASDGNKKWYVCCEVDTSGGNSKEERIKEKLISKAKASGLSGMNDENAGEVSEVYEGNKFVCMLILELP